MLKNGGGGGLSPETLHEFLARQRSGQDHLHRHDAIEIPLPGLIDDAHAAPCDLVHEIVFTERSQWRTRRTGFWRSQVSSRGGQPLRLENLEDLALGVGHVERSSERAPGAQTFR